MTENDNHHEAIPNTTTIVPYTKCNDNNDFPYETTIHFPFEKECKPKPIIEGSTAVKPSI